eukprot:1940668-Prymnesium_polylepis.1
MMLVTERRIHKWPSHTIILRSLMSDAEAEDVTRDELESIFKDESSTMAFVERYQRFNFLTDPDVGAKAQEPRAQPEQRLIDTAMLAYVEKLERELAEARGPHGSAEPQAPPGEALSASLVPPADSTAQGHIP